MRVSFQSRVFTIHQVVLAKKKISLDPMAGSRTESEIVVVVLLRGHSGDSELLGVVEGGLHSSGGEVHESVLSMTGFNIPVDFLAKAYTPCRGINLSHFSGWWNVSM
nr:MAG TPA: hypothetical protein [Caudoviricetes sp.]